MNESWHPGEKHRDADLKKQNVLPVKQYLDEHYQEKISLDFLAEHFFISKYYLTRVFREQFGVSISSYLMNRRVTKSDVLKFLLEDNCSLVVRPSGTEPKLKIYISVSAENKEMAEKVEDEIAKTAEKWIC